MAINTIGDSQKDLVLQFLERLVFKRGNKEIEVLDRDGNPNIKFKNTLKNGIPTSSSEDGFYYDGADIYIKSGDNIINITKSCIPENVILMYKGNTPPEGWADYGGETGIPGVIYITNGTGRDVIKLQFNIGPDYPSSLVVGQKYDLPSIRVTKDGSAYSNYSYNEIRFQSSDTSIVKIENNKLVALKSGTVNIIVEIDENFTHTGDRIQYELPVNVKQIPNFYFNHTAYSFNVGDWHHFGVDISGLDDSLINELIFEDISNINPKSISEYHLFETAGTYYIKARLPQNEYHSAAETTNEMVVTVISSSKPQPNISFNGNEGHANARGEGISTPTLNNPNNITVTYSSSNTNVATVDSNGNIDVVGAGTTIITATFAGNDQYAPQSISYTLTINPIVVTNPTIELSQDSYTYDGNAKTPTVTVKDGNVIIPSTEYTVSYNNNTNVGTATVTITDKEGGNYTINGSTTFTISESQQEDEITKYFKRTNTQVKENSGTGIDTDNLKIKIIDNRSSRTNPFTSITINYGENTSKSWSGGISKDITDNEIIINELDGKYLTNGWAVWGHEGDSISIIDNEYDNQTGEGQYAGSSFNSADDSDIKFEKGKCYNITVSGTGIAGQNNLAKLTSIDDNTGSSQVQSQSKIKVSIKNNSGETINLKKLKFSGSDWEFTKTFDSETAINSGKTHTTDEINAETYKDKQLTTITIIDSNNKEITIPTESGLAINFDMGYVYSIVLSKSGEQPSDELFETLLGEFNSVLNKNINQQDTPNTYNYLLSMYNEAETEWNKDASDSDSLFNSELYPEVVEYRNTSDNSGNSQTHEAMQAWLMAMCLAELTVSSGTNTNNQTELYAKAMEYGDTDVYKVGSADDDGNIIASSNYGYKQDAMIARFAAGAVYAINHDDCIEDINSSRGELDGNLIKANSFDDLACNKTSIIGYKPELDQIIPAAPGPYTINSDYNSINKKVKGQSDSIIYGNGNSDDQKDYNYKMDYAINKYVKENYNLWDDTNNVQSSINTFKGQSDEIRQIVFESGLIGICSNPIFFGKKKFKYLNSIDTTSFSNAWRHEFALADNTNEYCGSNEYWYKGPFSDWYEELFTNRPALNDVNDSDDINGELTDELEYLQDMLNIFDERCFTYYKLYGRRRPLGGIESGPVYSEYNHNTKNGLQISMAAKYLADRRSTGEWPYDTINGWDDFPGDSPKSYPSGHSAQSWGMAMLLSQINPSMVRTYMKNGWRFGCERAIARAHWNSDILFGRLSALADLPVVNAMNGSSFMNNYNSLRQKAGNSSINKSGNSVTPSGNNIIITFVNTTGNTIHLGGFKPYVIPTENVDDVTSSEGILHASLEGHIDGENIILANNESVTLQYPPDDYINYFKAVGYDGTLYWQNNSDGVVVYTYREDGSHWSEDYTTQYKSGKINYGQEYIFNIVNR